MKFLHASPLLFLLVACTAQTVEPTPTPVSPQPSAQTNQAFTVSWQSREVSKNASGMPRTEITLVKSTTNERLVTTTCDGTVSPIAVEHSFTAVRCWWMSGGYDYAVFPVPNGMKAEKRTVDVEGGLGAWGRI